MDGFPKLLILLFVWLSSYLHIITAQDDSAEATSSCSMSCEPITVVQCSSQSYSNTGFPNFFDQLNQTAADEIAFNIQIAEATNCYEYSRTFLCGLLLPECSENEGLIFPKRQMCVDFYAGCSGLLKQSGNEALIPDCDTFAENPEPVCLDEAPIPMAEELTTASITEESTSMSTTEESTSMFTTDESLPMSTTEESTTMSTTYSYIDDSAEESTSMSTTKDTTSMFTTEESLPMSTTEESTTMSTTYSYIGEMTDTPASCSMSCEPISVFQCSSQSYLNTGFPNFFDQLDQTAANEVAWYIDITEATNCYEHSRKFLCGLLLPECRENKGLIFPDRQTCIDFYEGCGALIKDLGDDNLIIDCNDFAEKPGPVCLEQAPALNTDEPTTVSIPDSESDETANSTTSCSFSCEPISISQCTSQTYSRTGFPNFFDNLDQKAAGDFAFYIDLVEAYNCSEQSREFLCGLLLPECRENEGLIFPDRQTCVNFYNGCSALLVATGNQGWIEDCYNFAENPEPVCFEQSLILSTEESTTVSVPESEIGDMIFVTDIGIEGTNATPKVLMGSLYTMDLVEIPVEGLQHPFAIDFDPEDLKVYWTDIGAKSISRASLDGQDQEELVTSLGVPDGLALDVINRHLFWTDAGNNQIEMANMDGTSRQVIIDSDLDEPRAIVVDPSESRLFWTDWGENPKIERANIDGSMRVTLINTELALPNGLAIDLLRQELYWCDAGLNRIDRSDFNGGSRYWIEFTVDIHPLDIGIYKNVIYWSDWALSGLGRVDRFTWDDASVVGPAIFNRTGGVHIYQVDTGDSQTYACNSGEYQCEIPRTRVCIGESEVCDGYSDCEDGADEGDCVCDSPNYQCPVPDYRTCIGELELCDGYTDCLDETDESGCEPEATTASEPTTTCGPTDFECPIVYDESRACVGDWEVCDGFNDCYDGADEFNCYFENCKEEEHLCPVRGVAHRTCIGDWELCDGYVDCSDGNDESSCESGACSPDGPTPYQCPVIGDGRACIGDWEVCDGYTDCSDAADETGCKFEVRLVNGNNPNEGRVEIRVGISWGTVCDDSWGDVNAKIVCRQLGLPYENARARDSAAFGAGSGFIWLDNVHCVGSEEWLDECSHNGWGDHNCTHDEDVGVVCA